MADPSDLDGIPSRMDEKQSIDAGTKAHFLDASQTLQIAHSGLGEAMKSGKRIRIAVGLSRARTSALA